MLGLVLVLGSVLLGVLVVSRAAATSSVWALSRDLPAGAVLAAGDVRPVDVRLGAAADRYVAAGEAVVGRRLGHDVAAGELLARGALGAPDATDRVTVTIPFAGATAPTLARGERIEVWVSTPTCASVVLLRSVAVDDVRDAGTGLTGGDGLEVVVSVSPDVAARVVAALALDQVTLRAGVLSGPSAAEGADEPASALPSLAACGAADGSGAGGGGTASGSAAPSPTAS